MRQFVRKLAVFFIAIALTSFALFNQRWELFSDRSTRKICKCGQWNCARNLTARSETVRYADNIFSIGGYLSIIQTWFLQSEKILLNISLTKNVEFREFKDLTIPISDYPRKVVKKSETTKFMLGPLIKNKIEKINGTLLSSNFSWRQKSRIPPAF